MRGGRPPRDRRTRVARYAITGVCAHESARVLILVEPEVLNVRKTEEVIITYVNRAISVREGLN